MHENQDVNIVSRDNINSLIQLCLQTEQDRGLSKNSIIELKRYLNKFSSYCECQNICSVKDLTPPFLVVPTKQCGSIISTSYIL
jgi:site-specific recombinase XerD